jgi:hypothetical protein
MAPSLAQNASAAGESSKDSQIYLLFVIGGVASVGAAGYILRRQNTAPDREFERIAVNIRERKPEVDWAERSAAPNNVVVTLTAPAGFTHVQESQEDSERKSLADLTNPDEAVDALPTHSIATSSMTPKIPEANALDPDLMDRLASALDNATIISGGLSGNSAAVVATRPRSRAKAWPFWLLAGGVLVGTLIVISSPKRSQKRIPV